MDLVKSEIIKQIKDNNRRETKSCHRYRETATEKFMPGPCIHGSDKSQ